MQVIRLFVIVFMFSYQFLAATTSELDSLKTAVKAMPEDSLKGEVYLQIAYLLYSGDESVVYANKALKLSKKLNNKMLLGKSYHRLAWCHGLDKMNLKTAYLDSASIQFTSIGNLRGLGMVYDTKGTILMAYGSFKEAFESYQQAYDLYLKIRDPERQAGILNNWAIAEYTSGNTKGALQKYQKALDFRLTEKPISHVDIFRLYQGMGECYRLNGKLDLAATNYLKGYEHIKTVENIGVVESMLSLANLIYEATEKKMDTTSILDKIKGYGFKSSSELINASENTKDVAERIDIQNSIMDVKRQHYILNKNFEAAYQILLKQKQMQEEYKLSESSLEAMADMKIKFEKDQLKIQLLEEEVLNQKGQDLMNILLFSLGGLFLISLIGFQYYKNRIKTSQIVLHEVQREQQIIAMHSMLEGQEKERTRIARDLHDGLGNLLSSLKVNIGSLQINFDDNNSKKMYGNASQMIDEACTEVRKIAHEMMPQSLKKLGLRKALEDLVLKMDAIHEFDAEFYVHGTEKILEDNTNVMLFRIVQEALNNTVKYAKAKEVSVQITYSEDWFDLTIEDDGIGFDPKALGNDKGMGLKSIAFRAAFIGGTYDLNSRPGLGTLVTINIPFDNINKL